MGRSEPIEYGTLEPENDVLIVVSNVYYPKQREHYKIVHGEVRCMMSGPQAEKKFNRDNPTIDEVQKQRKREKKLAS